MSKFIERVKKRQKTYLQAILPERVNIAKSCFYQTVAMVAAFGQERRGRAYFQAGSASWKVVSDEKDDGVSPTHYSYVYEGWSVIPTMLPELHCWTIWIPSPEEEPVFIDPTVVYLPKLAKEAGLNWSVEEPKDGLWTPASQLPKDWVYQADPDACRHGWAIALRILQGLK